MSMFTFFRSDIKVHPCGGVGPRSNISASKNQVQLSLVSASTTAIDNGYMLLLASLPTATIIMPLYLPFRKHASTPFTGLHPCKKLVFIATNDTYNL